MSFAWRYMDLSYQAKLKNHELSYSVVDELFFPTRELRISRGRDSSLATLRVGHSLTIPSQREREMCPTDTTVYALPFAATKKDEEAWLAEAFIILDTDGDGTIGGSDLNAFFSGHLRKALTHEEIASMIGAADVNGDGGVDLHEFQLLASVSLSSLRSPTFLSKQRQEVERTVLRSIFDVLDVNKDGLLSAVDLNKFMTMIGSPLSDQDVHSMFDMAGLHQVPTVAIDFNAFLKLVNPLV